MGSQYAELDLDCSHPDVMVKVDSDGTLYFDPPRFAQIVSIRSPDEILDQDQIGRPYDQIRTGTYCEQDCANWSALFGALNDDW